MFTTYWKFYRIPRHQFIFPTIYCGDTYTRNNCPNLIAMLMTVIVHSKPGGSPDRPIPLSTTNPQKKNASVNQSFILSFYLLITLDRAYIEPVARHLKGMDLCLLAQPLDE